MPELPDPGKEEATAPLPETAAHVHDPSPGDRERPAAATCDLDLTSDDPSGKRDAAGAPAPNPLQAGQRLDDYEIISVLGAGAFATVYLARQLSLDRQVALKVSANSGTEARTLASLEHEHIVRVFSETIDGHHNRRLLCMQYVNGTTLQQVLEILARRDPATRNGQAILDAIDELSTRPAMFDPAALRDRELLRGADWIEAVCWIGGRLAEALAHAHSQGVLHRDIKPANILLNRYGRPMLADFNIAFDPRPVEGASRRMFGGTLAYMSPEHIDAFHPDGTTSADVVDQRSDIYSLGMVLFEMLTGRVAAPDSLPASTRLMLWELAAFRRTAAPSPARERPVPEVLDRIVRRCLQPMPADRYQTADALAHALDGCREHRQIERKLPRGGRLIRLIRSHPFSLGLLLVLLPHLLGSVVNISYNQLRIVDRLDPAQQLVFAELVLGYNLAVYPLCVAVGIAVVWPLVRMGRRLAGGELVDPAEVADSRRRLLQLPRWAMLLSAIGWLPGGVLFPVGLHLAAGPCPSGVFGHFLLSFTISGLIALTYSVFAIQFLVLGVLYPRWWTDAQGIRRHARNELQPVPRLLGLLQVLSGLIPLAGAVLMVEVGPDEFTSGYQGFRLLVTALIGLGMLGFCVAVSVSGVLGRCVAALSGGESPLPLP
jgi:serine/threonine protein kinase